MKTHLQHLAAIFALVAMACLQTTAQDIPTWTDITPVAWSGDFERVTFSKGARALAAADNGWIYQSLDTGRTWSNIYNGFTNKKGYYTYGDSKYVVNNVPALDFFTDSLHGVYIGALHSTSYDTTLIAYTSDGGQTWQNSQTTFNNCAVNSNLFWKSKDTALVSIFNESTFENYIYISANCGKSWSRTIGKLSTYSDACQIYFPTPSHGYAFSTGYYGETTDGGKTWTKSSFTGLQVLSSLTFSNGQTIFNFNTLPTTKFPKCTFRTKQVVQIADLGNGNVFGIEGAWATSMDYVIDNSTDSGKTWTQQTIPAIYNTGGLISIAFLNSKVGITVGRGLYSLVTKDGGKTWTPYVHAAGDWFKNIYAKSKDEVYITGNTGRLFHTSNGGTTWDYRDLYKTALQQIVFPTKDTGYISASGAIFRTIDAGVTWKRFNQDYSGGMLCFPTKDVGFTGFDNSGNLELTTDAGQTWNWIGDMTFYTYVTQPAGSGYFSSSTEGLISGDNSLLYTNDGGNTWQDKATGVTANSIIYENGNWLLTETSNKIYFCDKDINCKITHSNADAGYSISAIRDANTIYISESMQSSSNHVTDSLLISKDGGNTWKVIQDSTFFGNFSFGDVNTVYNIVGYTITKGLYNAPIASTTTLSNFSKTGSLVSFVLTNSTNTSFPATIEVLNGSNAVVSQTTATITSGATETVNLSALPAGTYTIEVVPNDKTIGTAQSQSFTLGTSAVGIVEAAAKSYRLVGNTLVFSNTQCAVYSMLGVRLSPQGSMSVTLPAGVYVVQTPQGTDKVVVTR